MQRGQAAGFVIYRDGLARWSKFSRLVKVQIKASQRLELGQKVNNCKRPQAWARSVKCSVQSSSRQAISSRRASVLVPHPRPPRSTQTPPLRIPLDIASPTHPRYSSAPPDASAPAREIPPAPDLLHAPVDIHLLITNQLPALHSCRHHVRRTRPARARLQA